MRILKIRWTGFASTGHWLRGSLLAQYRFSAFLVERGWWAK